MLLIVASTTRDQSIVPVDTGRYSYWWRESDTVLSIEYRYSSGRTTPAPQRSADCERWWGRGCRNTGSKSSTMICGGSSPRLRYPTASSRSARARSAIGPRSWRAEVKTLAPAAQLRSRSWCDVAESRPAVADGCGWSGPAHRR